jgi:hypothetical protein
MPPPQEKWKTRSLEADWSEARDLARGRGALSNATGRFEKQYAEPFDDGWSDEADEDWKPQALKTETIVERPKTIITYNTSPDISFDRTINLQGLRAWLHLLLCAAEPCLSRAVAGAGFRDQDFRQAWRGSAAGAGAVEEDLQARPHHAGGRH